MSPNPQTGGVRWVFFSHTLCSVACSSLFAPQPADWKRADWKREPEPADWKREPADWKREPADWKREPADWKREPADWRREPEPADWKREPADWKREPADWRREPEPADWKREPADWKRQVRPFLPLFTWIDIDTLHSPPTGNVQTGSDLYYPVVFNVGFTFFTPCPIFISFFSFSSWPRHISWLPPCHTAPPPAPLFVFICLVQPTTFGCLMTLLCQGYCVPVASSFEISTPIGSCPHILDLQCHHHYHHHWCDSAAQVRQCGGVLLE